MVMKATYPLCFNYLTELFGTDLIFKFSDIVFTQNIKGLTFSGLEGGGDKLQFHVFLREVVQA